MTVEFKAKPDFAKPTQLDCHRKSFRPWGKLDVQKCRYDAASQNLLVVLYKHPDHLVVWEALDRNESHLEETAKNIAPYATPENRAAAQDSTRQNDASGTSVSVVQAKHADTAVAPTSFSNSFILELD